MFSSNLCCSKNKCSHPLVVGMWIKVYARSNRKGHANPGPQCGGRVWLLWDVSTSDVIEQTVSSCCVCFSLAGTSPYIYKTCRGNSWVSVLWPTYWTCPARYQRWSMPAVMHHGPIGLRHLVIITDHFSWPPQERINLISVRCVIVDFYIYKIATLYVHTVVLWVLPKKVLNMEYSLWFFVTSQMFPWISILGLPPKYPTYLAPSFSPLITQWSVVIQGTSLDLLIDVDITITWLTAWLVK